MHQHCRLTQRGLVSAALREVFSAQDANQAKERVSHVIERLEPVAPKICRLLEDAEADLLAFYGFPREHQSKLRSTDENVKGLGGACRVAFRGGIGRARFSEDLRSARVASFSDGAARIGPISGMRRLRRRRRRAGRDGQRALGCAVGVVDPRAKRRIWG